jgi:hypothetical protein
MVFIEFVSGDSEEEANPEKLKGKKRSYTESTRDTESTGDTEKSKPSLAEEHIDRLKNVYAQVVVVKFSGEPNHSELSSLGGSIELLKKKRKSGNTVGLWHLDHPEAVIKVLKEGNELPCIQSIEKADRNLGLDLYYKPCFQTLKVHSLPNDVRINEVARFFPNASSIELKNRRRVNFLFESKNHKKVFGYKEAVLRYDTKKECIEAFRSRHHIFLNHGKKYIVSFGKLNK